MWYFLEQMHCFVLRNEGDRYLLVGDYYVYGIMAGEMVRSIESLGSELTTEFVPTQF